MPQRSSRWKFSVSAGKIDEQEKLVRSVLLIQVQAALTRL